MRLSTFGKKLGSNTGITQLMDDLGQAMSVNRHMRMLGGGNPGQIPAVQSLFRERMQAIMDDGDAFERMVGNYGPPEGDPKFVAALAHLLEREFGWPVGPENIAVTNGSQSASFMLFNLFAGEDDQGEPGNVLLPLAPEYIGYGDQGLGDYFFTAVRPTIQHLDDHVFKYRVDFDAIKVGNHTAAICVSRPTNPTGNVLTDDEVTHLMALAEDHDIPLIIDNAYGTPFPNIIFTEATPFWNENIVVCMSLSKLGLPGVRTGIVVARQEIIKAVSSVNAVLNLTTGGFGPALTLDLIESGEIIRISRDIIRPFYKEKADLSMAVLLSELDGYSFHVHKPEGALFLWLWFDALPITSQELYERLKTRGVLIIPGHHFFPGLEDEWRHTRECIRVTYSQDQAMVEAGLKIIAEEVKKAYDGG
jgi:valine--pyruvate aminotransferase